MPELTFVTGNQEKYHIARSTFERQGIELVQKTYDIDEIQSEDTERIVRDKVSKAYQATGSPVVVNDDSWSFHGLNGFPGPYMKSVNHWFTAEDFLNLTRYLTDRRVTLSQWIAYQDADTTKLFERKYSGLILTESRGSYGSGLQKIITMPGDDGRSVSEAYDAGINITDREVSEGWNEFLVWYKDYLS